MFIIMSYANSGSFASSFPIWMPFLFSLSLCLVWLLWLGPPILCWRKVAVVDIFVLFLILEEKLSAFHNWVLSYLWVCHIWPILGWGMFPLYSVLTFWSVLIINGCWILLNAFSASIEMIEWFFLHFVNVV